MIYKELFVKVYLLKDINKKNINETLSNFVNYVMNKDSKLATIHTRNGYKRYSLSSLSPTENDGIYKKDEIYEFTIRGVDSNIIDKFEMVLKKERNENFIVFDINKHLIDIKYIKELRSLTPAIITLKDEENNKLRCFNLLKDNIEIAQKKIFENLLKKYNFINKVNLKIEYNDIFENINTMHEIAIVSNYKGIKLLGYKYLLEFKNNDISQSFAEIALINGIAEKNTLSFGFTNKAKGVIKLVK